MTNVGLFNWLNDRASGILFHPTSLPSEYCIGGFGQSAKDFIDLIARCGVKYWQVLPLGPTGYGDSPYQSYSSHALNPYLLDWNKLIEYGWLSKESVGSIRTKRLDVVDYKTIRHFHYQLRDLAFQEGLKDPRFKDEFNSFIKDQETWIHDYTLFMALKEYYCGDMWTNWKKNHREYEDAIKLTLPVDILQKVEILKFEQFILFKQWKSIKAYANSQGIQIIGDIPIYVSPDSVDIWAHRKVFQVTQTGKSTNLAGVPPDYFNADGQFWGNPLYNWKALIDSNFDWWIDRLAHNSGLYDVVRFDHFRALESYWSIPAKAKKAKEGKWVKGPGICFFEAIKDHLPDIRMILEDLGEITQDVVDLKNQTGCPGLAVLQFAFGGDSKNFYLPHNVSENTVIYTGTHDNDTSRGWYESTDEKCKDHLRRYLQVSGDEVSWDLIRSAFKSNAKICIIPVQDLLSLDSGSRMNLPGYATGNWTWRLTQEQMNELGVNCAEYLKYLSDLYGR